MSTLKGRNAHKGRTFGGVAACPHCSSPIRVFVTARRTQCILDVVSLAYSLPYVPLEEVAPGDATYADPATAIPSVEAAVNAASVTTPTGVPDAEGGIGAPLVAHPGERGFDDDEAPFPKGSQGHLGLR